MPRIESRLRYVDHVEGAGIALFREACRRNLEGLVAKWRRGRYHTDGQTTSWFKVRNPRYLQAEGQRSCSVPEALQPIEVGKTSALS